MNRTEYLVVQNLAKLRAAISILRSIPPELLHDQADGFWAACKTMDGIEDSLWKWIHGSVGEEVTRGQAS